MTGRHPFSTVLPAAAAADDPRTGLSDGQLLGRFVEGRDTAAFEALVRRHGPMILGVCRRLLRDGHDADDAFQATFLVLVRKAATVSPRDALAGWLHGVARRTALKARALAARRRLRETLPASLPEPAAPATEAANDLRPVLDRELGRMPERYRVPIVLCDLEGMPQKAAAELLGCPEGTVSGRLTRGRRMLADRLSRHAPTVLSAGWAAAVAGDAAMSAPLVAATVQGVCELMTGTAATGGNATAAAVLAEKVVHAMFVQRVRLFGLVLLVAAALGTAAGGWLLRARAVPPAKQPPPASSVTMRGPQFDDNSDILHITRRSGRVVPGPDRAPNARLVIEF